MTITRIITAVIFFCLTVAGIATAYASSVDINDKIFRIILVMFLSYIGDWVYRIVMKLGADGGPES